jgi:plasmid stability protein
MEGTMASITIRNLDDTLKRRLRKRAAEHGRSMEEEAREILRLLVGEPAPPVNIAAAIRARVAAFGGGPRPSAPRADARTAGSCCCYHRLPAPVRLAALGFLIRRRGSDAFRSNGQPV